MIASPCSHPTCAPYPLLRTSPTTFRTEFTQQFISVKTWNWSVWLQQLLCLLLSLHFNDHFPGEPGLASVYWSKGWWRWCWQLDYWSYKSRKAPVKSLPLTNQHPVFYRPDALPVAQPTVSKHWSEKYHIPWTCLPQAHLGSSNFVSDH